MPRKIVRSNSTNRNAVASTMGNMEEDLCHALHIVSAISRLGRIASLSTTDTIEDGDFQAIGCAIHYLAKHLEDGALGSVYEIASDCSFDLH